MSLFWEYFRKTLRFLLIWRPGPLAQLAKGGAGALDEAREDIVWLRKQFLPVLCDDDYRERFAKSRKIRRYSKETDEQYANRIIYAYAWQLLGGRVAGLYEILRYYGYEGVDIYNMADDDPDRWAEFRVDVNPEAGAGYTENDFYLLDWVINDNKPARSKLAQLRMYLTGTAATVKMAAGMQYGEAITVYPWTLTELTQSSQVSAAMTYQAVETTTIYPLEAS